MITMLLHVRNGPEPEREIHARDDDLNFLVLRFHGQERVRARELIASHDRLCDSIENWRRDEAEIAVHIRSATYLTHPQDEHHDRECNTLGPPRV